MARGLLPGGREDDDAPHTVMSSTLDPDLLRGSVVVAVDGSDHDGRAVTWAADHAAAEHRRLAVIGVCDPASAASPITVDAVADAAATARARHHDLTVLTQVVPGEPRRVLVEASRHAFDLVLGSRGRGTVTSVVLGSVSAAVSAHARCPTIVCRPRSHEPVPGGVVVGTDGTPASLPVVEFAYRQAFLRGLPLTVLHSVGSGAVPTQVHDGRSDVPAPPVRVPAAELAQSVAGLDVDYPGVPVTVSTVRRPVHEALLRAHPAAELVVVGRRTVRPARLTDGSTATAVLERAHADVAVVPEQTVLRADDRRRRRRAR